MYTTINHATVKISCPKWLFPGTLLSGRKELRSLQATPFPGAFHSSLILIQLGRLATATDSNFNDPCQIMFMKLTVFLNVSIDDLSHITIVEKTVRPPHLPVLW